MTATDLLLQLRVSGIAVSTDGDKLRLRARLGALTDALRAEIQAAKIELIELLRPDLQDHAQYASADSLLAATSS